MLRGPMTYRVKNCGCWEMVGPRNMPAFFTHQCEAHVFPSSTPSEEPNLKPEDVLGEPDNGEDPDLKPEDVVEEPEDREDDRGLGSPVVEGDDVDLLGLK